MSKWTAINGYEGLYEISKKGEIKSLLRNKLMKVREGRGGYITVELTKEGCKSTKALHRLVAETFIPNCEDKPLVNHINGIKTDYRIKNLEWATHSENTLHAWRTNLIKRKGRLQSNIMNLTTPKSIVSLKHAA